MGTEPTIKKGHSEASSDSGWTALAAPTQTEKKTWSNQVVGVVDNETALLIVTSASLRVKEPLGLVKILQDKQPAEDLARFFIDKKVTTLVTDNDMNGVQGTELILTIAKIDLEWAKKMSFVLNTGLILKARDAFDRLNVELDKLGLKKAVIVEKGDIKDLFDAVEQSWIQ